MICPYRNVTGTEMSQKVLSRYMSGIYCVSSYERLCMVYTGYIPDIYFFQLVYIKHIPGIWHFYWQIQGICHVYDKYIPGGWCCGGGHDPMPPEPPAITSPGLVITVILFDSPPLHILLLLMWMCTALLDTKNDGKTPFFARTAHKAFHLGQYR